MERERAPKRRGFAEAESVGGRVAAAGSAAGGETVLQERYRGIFRSAPDGILLVDRGGVIRDLNPRAAQLFAYPEEELLGETVEVLVPEALRPLHVRERARYVRRPWARPMEGGRELRGRRKDGTEFPAQISLSPLQTAEGRFFVVVVRDLTSLRRLRQLGSAALRAVEEERERIARELHDALAQRLSTLLLLVRVAGEQQDGARAAQLEEMRLQLRRATEEVRRIARGLRPPGLDEAGVVAALRTHLAEVAEAAPLEVELEAEPVDRWLSSEGRLVVYRVVQEALSNVLRHAQASAVRVRLARTGGRIVAVVADDGRGFSPGEEEAGGLGVLGMRERAAGVGGRLVLESRPSRGTTVRLEIPIVGPGGEEAERR